MQHANVLSVPCFCILGLETLAMVCSGDTPSQSLVRGFGFCTIRFNGVGQLPIIIPLLAGQTDTVGSRSPSFLGASRLPAPQGPFPASSL